MGEVHRSVGASLARVKHAERSWDRRIDPRSAVQAVGEPALACSVPVVARDPVAVAGEPAAIGPDVEDEGEGDDEPAEQAQASGSPDENVGDRRPRQEDETEHRQQRGPAEGHAPPGRLDQPPEDDQGARADEAQDGDRATHGSKSPCDATTGASREHATGSCERQWAVRPVMLPGIIARMTERGLPSMDGAPACPFVAFGDDRDGRSTSPDHRHRCFAESPPAPRALAHQEAYCLSSAFPVCPVFQDWARREAAHGRGTGDRAETAPSAVPSAYVDDELDEDIPPPSPRDPADPP